MHSISLPSGKSEFARSLPNLSGFVGECLRMYSEGEIEINWENIELRNKEKKAFEFTSKIERRLARIEKMLAELHIRE